MTATFLLLGLTVTTQATSAVPKAIHPENPVYSTLRTKGATLAGVQVDFPAPLHKEGTSAEAEHADLKRLTGSDRSLAEFTRDSVSAPIILKTRDEPAGEKGIVRMADLWFVVRASLDEIDPTSADSSTGEGKTVEAGNMRFGSVRLEPKDLSARGITPGAGKSGSREWYIHLTSRMLDRIHVEATDRMTATRSDGSWIVGTITDSRFDADQTLPNVWHAIKRQGATEKPGLDEVYAGGASIITISRLASVEGALLIEAHFAFFEPKAWFNGAPVLRSKIGVVAQDRIRGLRRALAKSRKGEGGRSPTGRPGG